MRAVTAGWEDDKYCDLALGDCQVVEKLSNDSQLRSAAALNAGLARLQIDTITSLRQAKIDFAESL